MKERNNADACSQYEIILVPELINKLTHFEGEFFKGIFLHNISEAFGIFGPLWCDFYFYHQEMNVVALIFIIHRRFIMELFERGLNSLILGKCFSCFIYNTPFVIHQIHFTNTKRVK